MKYIVLFTIFCLTFACSPKGDNQAHSFMVPLAADGPFFDGPNTLQGSMVIKPENLGIDKLDDLQHLQLESLVLSVPEAFLPHIEQATLSIVSKNNKMQTLATADASHLKGNKCLFQIAKEIGKLSPYFQDGTVTVVADVTLKEEVDANWLSDLQINTILTIKNRP